MSKSIKKTVYLVFLAIFILLLYLVYTIWPAQIVDFIWLENTYLVIFFFAFVWWVFFLTAATFYTTLATFVVWWADLLTLSLISAIWLTIGDFFFYFLGRKAKLFINDSKYKSKVEKFSNWIRAKSDKTIFWFLLLYWSFAPLPNDIPSSWLWIAWYNWKKMILPIFVWNINYNLLIWSLAMFGYGIYWVL